MKEKEIRARYAARKCETRQEYREWYVEIDDAQTHANHPYADKTNELHIKIKQLEARKNALRIEILAINVEQSTMYAQLHELNAERKEMNRVFHELKHQCAQLTPKDELVQEVQPSDPA